MTYKRPKSSARVMPLRGITRASSFGALPAFRERLSDLPGPEAGINI